MNNGANFLVTLVGLTVVALGFVVALRAKRQFGFYAPLGFAVAVLAHRICVVSVLPMTHGREHQEALRDAAAKLPSDDLLFYMSANGHAMAIWWLGAIFFLLCGLLDIKAAAGPPDRTLRWTLVVVGTLFIVLSAFYPALVISRLVS